MTKLTPIIEGMTLLEHKGVETMFTTSSVIVVRTNEAVTDEERQHLEAIGWSSDSRGTKAHKVWTYRTS